MSDKYYRGLTNSLNDVKYKLQLASMTLKINENKNNITGIKYNISEIKKFSEKINDNETNISNNLTKINDNDDDIDEIKSNLNKIENDISSNTTKIDNYTKGLNLINNNTTNNSNDISNNLAKINEIKSDLCNIDFDSNNKFSIENFFIYNIEIENNYILNKDKPNFSIFNYNLEDNFKKDGILEVNCKLLYDYTSYNNIGSLMHIFKLYDENNNVLYEYKNLKTNGGDNLQDDLTQIDLFYVNLNDNYSIIKIELFLDNISK